MHHLTTRLFLLVLAALVTHTLGFAQVNTPTSTVSAATNIPSETATSPSAAASSQGPGEGEGSSHMGGGPASSACADQPVLNRCLETTTTEFNRCKGDDYSCRCEKQKAITQCYANCPMDLGVNNSKVLQDVYCKQAVSAGSTTTGPSSASSTSSTSESSSSGSSDSGSSSFKMASATTTGGTTTASAGAKATGGAVGVKKGSVQAGLGALALMVVGFVI